MGHRETSQIRRGSSQHLDCLVGKEEEQAKSKEGIEGISRQWRSREDKRGGGCHELGKVQSKEQVNTVSAYRTCGPLAGMVS